MGKTYEKVGNQLRVVETKTNDNLVSLKVLRQNKKRLVDAKQAYLARINPMIDELNEAIDKAVALKVPEEQAPVIAEE